MGWVKGCLRLLAFGWFSPLKDLTVPYQLSNSGCSIDVSPDDRKEHTHCEYIVEERNVNSFNCSRIRLIRVQQLELLRDRAEDVSNLKARRRITAIQQASFCLKLKSCKSHQTPCFSTLGLGFSYRLPSEVMDQLAYLFQKSALTAS